MINFKHLSIPDVVLIEPQVFNDERGFFFESFNQKEFNDALKLNVNFIQDNHSKSTYGVLRGLHFQKSPHEQGKLVRVIKGEVFDVAVDIRPKSLTFGNWVGVNLSEENKKQLWIPPGFAHGFLVLSKNAEFLYKTTAYYHPECETTIKFDDKHLDIDWPNVKGNYILSKKDKSGFSLLDLKKNFNDLIN